MTGALSDTHDQVRQRVHSAMTAAMRANPRALEMVAEAMEDDAHDREFVRESRRLVLACGAALSATLAIHRPFRDARNWEMCRACCSGQCPTLRQICHALAAYSVRPQSLDRAEAWRRADANLGPSAGALTIEETDDCFIARPSRPAAGDHRSLLLIDRRTGALTRWPDLPTEKLIDHYRRYLRGEL